MCSKMRENLKSIIVGKGGLQMNELEIKNTLAKIESLMMMTCEGCSMPEMIKPLIDKIKKLLDCEIKS